VEWATTREPQCNTLQVGTLIQLAEVPDEDNTHVLMVTLLKIQPESHVTMACEPTKSLLVKTTWPLGTLRGPHRRTAVQVGTLVQLADVPEVESVQVANVVLLSEYPEAQVTVA
jgi:hypothetical protein